MSCILLKNSNASISLETTSGDPFAKILHTKQIRFMYFTKATGMSGLNMLFL